MSFVEQAIVKGAKAFQRLAKNHTRARKNPNTIDLSQETEEFISEPDEDVPKSSDGAASSATVIQAEQDGHAPESSPQPKIDETSANNQIVLPAGVFDEIQNATQAHIEMRDCEREAHVTAQHLERRLDSLDEQKRELAEARADGMKHISESCIDIQRELQKRLGEKEEIFGLLEEIEGYLREDHENYRERTGGFFEMWRQISNQGLRDMRRDGDVVPLPSAVLPAKKAELCRDCGQAPGIDVEIGFADVDDGYLNAGTGAELAMNRHDNATVLRWLDGDEGTSNAFPYEPDNLDSWSARSMEIGKARVWLPRENDDGGSIAGRST